MQIFKTKNVFFGKIQIRQRTRLAGLGGWHRPSSTRYIEGGVVRLTQTKSGALLIVVPLKIYT